MTDELVHEREALEELIQSDGWRYFKNRTMEETSGKGYVARMQTALTSSDIVAAQVVHRTMLEVQRMLQWVPNRINELHGDDQE